MSWGCDLLKQRDLIVEFNKLMGRAGRGRMGEITWNYFTVYEMIMFERYQWQNWPVIIVTSPPNTFKTSRSYILAYLIGFT